MSGKYRLIAADDEQAIRNGLQCFPWDKFGFELAGIAPNGKKALELCEAGESVDLLLADIKMPFMNGIELCREVHKRWPGAKKVILSGYRDFEYAQDAIKIGVRDYLLKPVDLDELKQLLIQLKTELDREADIHKQLNRMDPTPADSLLSTEVMEKPVIAETVVYVTEHMGEKISLDQAAEHVCLNISYFCQVFKKETGMTFSDYVRRYRIERAKELLKRCDLKIYEVGTLVGLPNPRYFTDTFRDVTGVTPKEYRNGTNPL